MLTLALWSFRLGFDGFLFFLDEEFLPKKEGGEPLSSSAVGKGWQDLEDFCLRHQRELGWGFPDPGNAG